MSVDSEMPLLDEARARNIISTALNQFRGEGVRGFLLNQEGNIIVDRLFNLFEGNPQLILDRIYPEVPKLLERLIRPETERDFVGSSSMMETTVFGLSDLFPLANRVLSPRESRRSLQLNVGIGTDGSSLSPTFPAYAELGIQRLKSVFEVLSDVRLRIFSTASLSTAINRTDLDQAALITGQQRAFLEDYLSAFYPSQLRDKIDLSDIKLDREDIDMRIQEMESESFREKLTVLRELMDKDTLDVLAKNSRRYAKSTDLTSALSYAYYHTISQTFGDGGNESCTVSIGGSSEYPFNVARWLTSHYSSDQHRVGFIISGLIGRTPPYLDRARFYDFLPSDMQVNMSTVASLPFTDLVDTRSPSAKELRFMGVCVGGLRRLEEFFKDNKNASWAASTT
ncbi:hypothetical protein IPG41_00930 [Candidatus Peregrinibacteria bacterium]|nr:MAG: hypothetical protein IPG41_00930 [Candidatus Peregrinibacteria bacterium]